MKLCLLLPCCAAALLASVDTQAADYTSKAPRYTFADTLPEQEAQLRDNPLLKQFREARQRQDADPQTPVYHFSCPNGVLNDPNGLCFWQGRWHMFYQTRPPEETRWHWAHAVSTDLVHWRDLPYALYPNPEEQCYSGATLVEKDRVIAIYHGRNLGTMIAVSHDPLLLNWEKLGGGTVIPIDKDGKQHHFLSHEDLPYRIYDPCLWKQGDTYYSLSGSVQYDGPAGKAVPAEFLFRSKDLIHWDFVHQFLEGDHFTKPGDDGACPYFWPIADRHMLIFFSHWSSAQYLLGDYDTAREKFVVTAHGKFSFGPVLNGGVQAPAAVPDGKGGLIAVFNMNAGLSSKGASGIMTLPRHLTLQGKEDLFMEPAGDIAALHGDPMHVDATALPVNKELVLPGVHGSALEIDAEIDPETAPVVELNVLRSPGREEFTRISLLANRNLTSRFMPPQEKLAVVTLDNTRSSQLPEALPRPPETASVFIPPGEPFKLRVFVDHGIVEVFVNGRQCVAVRTHPGRADSTGVSLLAVGQEAGLRSLTAWPMKSFQP